MGSVLWWRCRAKLTSVSTNKYLVERKAALVLSCEPRRSAWRGGCVCVSY